MKAAADVAFVNGVAAHSIELDDTYERASLHPGVVVWPAVLAVAGEPDLTLGEVLAAASTGYDAVCALGDLLDPGETYRRGFHPTGVCGPIGAAAAVAELLKLDAEQARHARGIAASMASGLMEFLADGAWTKPLHAGQAAANGVRAARLAGAGYTGPADAIGGRHGFLQAFGGRPTAPSRAAPRGGPHQDRGQALPVLPLHARLPGPAAGARARGGARAGRRHADPLRRPLGAAGAWWPKDDQRVRGQVDAQFSMAYGAALAVTHRRAGLDDFERAAELAPELDPAAAPRRVLPQRAAGRRLSRGVGRRGRGPHPRRMPCCSRSEDHFRGSAERPTQAPELLEEGRRAGRPRAGRDAVARVPGYAADAPLADRLAAAQ